LTGRRPVAGFRTQLSIEAYMAALIAAILGMALAFSSMLLSYYILTPKKRNQGSQG
jgi:hypothetical protein